MDEADKQRNYERAETLLSEQNFIAAVIVGAFATFFAAAFYAIATAVWNFAYGFLAVAVGIVIGISMQFLGRGIETKFAVVAAAYAITGCILGNVFWVIVAQVRRYSISPVEVLQTMSFSEIAERAVSHISFIDLVFWCVAVWFVVFLVKRPLSRADKLAIGMYELKG